MIVLVSMHVEFKIYNFNVFLIHIILFTTFYCFINYEKSLEIIWSFMLLFIFYRYINILYQNAIGNIYFYVPYI